MLKPGEIVELTVFRFDPTKDKNPCYVIYDVPYRRGMTVLDGLLYILEELDPSLSLRYSCRFKICGSCAAMINGVQRLACEAQILKLGNKIRVEPLAHFKIIKDLVVDIEPFLKKMEEIMPYLHAKSHTEQPRVAPKELEKYRSPSDCVWCAACFSACPIVATEPYYLGPAALAQLYRFVVDTREQEDVKPLRLLLADSATSGVWRCHQIYACKEVCPKNIDPGTLIAELKRMIAKARISEKI